MNFKTKNTDTFGSNPLEELTNDANAMVDKCIECGSCYINCAFNNYGDDPANCSQLTRDSNDFIKGKLNKISPELNHANFKCAECNRCYESCPEGIYRRHGNMLMKHMVKNPFKHNINIHPYSNWRIKQPAIETFLMGNWSDEEKEWYDNLNEMKPAEVLLYHGCYVYLQPSQCIKLEKMLTAAGVSFTAVGKLEYCCGTFAFYRGHNDMEKITPRLSNMLDAVKPKRIITNCGHCYNAMCDLSLHTNDNMEKPEVRHAADELLELNINKRLEFAYLERSVSIHDSCNFRELHDSNASLRKFLKRVGVIHEMMSHGKDGKCCGDVSRYYAVEAIESDNRKTKVRDFVATGADEMVTVCAGCYEHYHTIPQLHTVDFIDIAYDSFAKAMQEDMKDKKKKTDTRWENMAPVIDPA